MDREVRLSASVERGVRVTYWFRAEGRRYGPTADRAHIEFVDLDDAACDDPAGHDSGEGW